MVRTATCALVLIAVTLCPYLCLTQAAAGKRPARRACCGGGCCPAPTLPKGQDTPRDPAPAREGGTCLCHGAILGMHDAAPAVIDSGAAVWLHDVALAPSAVEHRTAGSFLRARSICSFAAASGREIRALIASLVI